MYLILSLISTSQATCDGLRMSEISRASCVCNAGRWEQTGRRTEPTYYTGSPEGPFVCRCRGRRDNNQLISYGGSAQHLIDAPVVSVWAQAAGLQNHQAESIYYHPARRHSHEIEQFQLTFIFTTAERRSTDLHHTHCAGERREGFNPAGHSNLFTRVSEGKWT